MKNALITGGGSKFGVKLTRALVDAGYMVYLVTSNPSTWADHPHVKIITVNWKNLDLADIKSIVTAVPDLDLIYFNHNASALTLDKFKPAQLQSLSYWQHSYFVACQFPFYLIHSLASHITPDTKIVWMLSELIKNPVDHHVGFADYIGNKFTNYCIMRSFSLSFPACFFGIHPDGGVNANSDTKAQDIVQLINREPAMLNGNVFDTQGNKLVLTNLD